MQPQLPSDAQRWLLRALDHTILVTTPNMVVVGDPIVEWTSLDVTLKYNEPGSGQFTVPGYSKIRDQLEAGNRIVVIRSGQILIAGPWEQRLYERSDDGENAGDGTLTVTFGDDLSRVVARQAYPNVAQTPETQTTDKWTYTGNAELALRALVDGNAAGGALAARRIPTLSMGNLNGVGTNITLTADRMEPLGDVLRRGALLGGNLGFKVFQQDNQLLFEVYAGRDLSDSIRYSYGLGNLKYIGYEVTAPTATSAIVGGQGDGVARALIERVNTAGQATWGRIETLVSRPGDAPLAELQADGDQALAEGAATARLQVNVLDTPTQRYGVDYGIGDTVAIEPWQGLEIADTVLTVHIQVWPTAGEIISATIGSQAALSDPQWIRRLRDIDRRVGRAERALVPGIP